MIAFDPSDRVPAMAVKELRQGLRATTFMNTFALLLVVGVVASIYAAGVWDSTVAGAPGRILFVACVGVLAFATCVLVPITVYRSFIIERESDAWATVLLTRLSPRAILGGKISVGLLQFVLHLSGTAPFLFSAYMLGGVSLVSVLVTIVSLSLAAPFAIAVAVSTAALGRSRGGRALGATVIAPGLTAGAFGLFALLGSVTESGLPAPLALALGGGVLFAATFALLLFESAASALTASALDASRGPRLALLAHLGSLPIVLRAAPVADQRDLAVALVVWAAFVTWANAVATSTREGRPPRSSWLNPGAGHAGALRFAAIANILSILLIALAAFPVGGRLAVAIELVPAWTFALFALGHAACGATGLTGAGPARVVLVASFAGSLAGGVVLALVTGSPVAALLNPLLALERPLSALGPLHLLPVFALVSAPIADRLLARATRQGALA